jgi:hypothetical protein
VERKGRRRGIIHCVAAAPPASKGVGLKMAVRLPFVGLGRTAAQKCTKIDLFTVYGLIIGHKSPTFDRK